MSTEAKPMPTDPVPWWVRWPWYGERRRDPVIDYGQTAFSAAKSAQTKGAPCFGDCRVERVE
jgi:hypothetical protein